MAGIPYVQDPAQMLWQFQQDAARTNLLQQQAATEQQQAQGMALKNLLMGRQIASDTALQQRMADMSAGEAQQVNTPAPAMNEEGPPSLRPAPVQLTPIQQMEQRMAQMDKAANDYDRLASTPNILPDDVLKLKKQASDLRAKIQDDQVKVYKEKGDQMTRIGGFAGSAAEARTPDALVTALKGIAAEDPRLVARLPVDFTPDGTVAPTPRTFDVLQNLANASMKQAEQLRAKNQAMTLQQTAVRDKAMEEYRIAELARRQEEDKARDVRAAADREAANWRTSYSQGQANQRQAQRLEFADEALGLREKKEQTRVEQQGQAAVQKDPTVANLDRYEKAFNAAKNVVENINNETWLKSRNVSEPAADAMMQEYRNAVQNFRANSGGKWSVEDQKKYASTLEKLNSFVQTIGQGKKPDTRVMQDVAGEINRMYQEQNAAALKATLRQREIVYNQGGDPNNVQSRASVDRAIASGKAKSWTDPDTGVQYLRFGPGKDDAFPIYTAPKVKRPRAGAPSLTNLVGGEEMVAE